MESVTKIDNDLAKFCQPRPKVVSGQVVRYGALRILHERLVEAIKQRRPILLVGPTGCGKSALLDWAYYSLQSSMRLYSATPSQVIADMTFVGQFESRLQVIKTYLQQDGNRWLHIDGFHMAISAGKGSQTPIGLLEHLLKNIPRACMQLICETTPKGAANLISAEPSIAQDFIRIEMESVDDRSAVEALMLLNAKPFVIDGVNFNVSIARDTAELLLLLTEQYIPSACQPGNSFKVVQGLLRSQIPKAKGEFTASISESQIYHALCQQTGLAESLVDERKPLDVDELREFFYSRLVGQTEAVECLVDRIALIKAGMTDPDRPFGVFLFLGPTGTGKTEICKILAEYIFGDRDRMIRVDMSELNNAERVWRLVGTGTTDKSLVSEVIAQPFSVILLDEFEKAHPAVWDLFLQVFDDGLLSDYGGRTADFRSTIIVLTSNLGYKLERGEAGFSGKTKEAVPSKNEEALHQTFRPEFLNRLDRIVWFEPLSRASMRKILQIELKRMLKRPAFRRRQWAVEWDGTTEDLLLERGFTPTLGARPLVRAIERYLLSPLAQVVASHAAPKGEQFLFIHRRGEKLEVRFVDPDAPAAVPPLADHGSSNNLSLAALARRAYGNGNEFYFLRDSFEQIQTTLADTAWTDSLEKLWEQTRQPVFWSEESRFQVLAELDTREEIKARLKSIESRLIRLGDYDWESPIARVIDILTSLALDLLRIQLAITALKSKAPEEVFLIIRQARRSTAPADLAAEAYKRVCNMYLSWAKARGASLTPVTGNEDDSAESVWLVGGLGIVPLINQEDGYHVWEFRRARRMIKAHVRVEILPVKQMKSEDNPAVLLRESRVHQAQSDADDDATEPGIIRRYRAKPHPLATDLRSGWSTGNLEKVLGGDFDLFTLEHVKREPDEAKISPHIRL